MQAMDSLIWDATFPLLRLEGSGCAAFARPDQRKREQRRRGRTDSGLLAECHGPRAGSAGDPTGWTGADVLVLHGDPELVHRDSIG